MKRRLDKHQKEALAFLHGRRSAGLFMAPGTGKTLTAIRWVMRRTNTLVICRRDDFLTWKDELEMEEQTCYCLEKSNKISEAAHQFHREYPQRPWLITTYDLIKNPAVMAYIQGTAFRTVIADESHMIKRWKSIRTKEVIKATRHIPRRMAMTGTPITNDPGDIFPQALFIDNGDTFGHNEWSFRNRYYIQSGPGWFLKADAKKKIIKKLQTLSFHVHEDDVLKLPPIRRLIKSVPISGQQRKLYEQVLNDWQLKNMEIDYIIVQLQKLKQIASGFYYDENHDAHYLRCHKLKLLKQLITDTDYLGNKRKIVIWGSYTAELSSIFELLQNKLNEKVAIFFDSTPQKKDLARKVFKQNDSVRFFLGQVDAGVGMNELVVADTAIYFSNSLRVVSRQQSMRRIRRRGSNRHKVITYYDLVTENTLDLPLLKSLKTKMSLASFILGKVREGQEIRKFLT